MLLGRPLVRIRHVWLALAATVVMLPLGLEEGLVVGSKNVTVGVAIVVEVEVVAGIAVAEERVVGIAVEEQAGAELAEVVGEQTAAVAVAAGFVAVVEVADGISLDSVALAVGAAGVAAVEQMLVPEVVRRSRSLLSVLLKVR